MNQTRNAAPMNSLQGGLMVNLSNKYPVFVGLGVFFWAFFLVFMRLLGPDVFATGSPALLLLFIAMFPVSFVILKALSVALRIPMNQMLIPVVIIDFTAMFIDGLAVGFTDFYGPTADQVAASASLLLWGVAVTLVMSLWFAHRPDQAA